MTLAVETRRQVAALDRPVVIFTNSFMLGGMEQHILTLASGLTRRGVDTAVILPSNDAVAPLRRDLAAAGAHVHALPDDRRGAVALAGRFGALRSILRAYPRHIFHLHNTGPDGGTLPMMAAKLSGASALIRTEHLPPDPAGSLRQRMLVHARDTMHTRVICVSQANRDEHVRRLKRDAVKFDVVANCVDLNAFDPRATEQGARSVRRLIGAADDEVVVGMIGRLAEHRKGGDVFVDMAVELAARRPGMKFAVVGEGPLRAPLEERATGRVTFLGATRPRRDEARSTDAALPDTAACYAAMDIVVMPSLWEGGPITVLEAMAMERPTVATDVGMVREVIEDGVNGRIVAPGSVAALVDAVSSLAEDRELRAAMGRRGRATIEARYTPDVMVERTLDVYRACPGVGHGD